MKKDIVRIDADKLKAEIERLKAENESIKCASNGAYCTGYDDAFYDLLSFLEKQKEQKPELVQQPTITYTYNSNASRDERLKAALLALLNSDLLKVKEGGYFTKQDLIEWVERIPTDKPAEWSEEDEEMLEYVISDVNEAKQLYTPRDAKKMADKEIAWLKSLRPQKKED